MSTVSFLAGQVLDAGEIRASGALLLKPTQQCALMLALDGDRLDHNGRRGWRHPNGSSPIAPSTVRTLASLGLIVVITHSRFKRHARLTKRGNWYARTLMTDAIERVKAIRAARAARNHSASATGEATP